MNDRITVFELMGHEFRTPIARIIGMADFALQTELSLVQRRCLDSIKCSSALMLQNVNSLIEYKRIQSGCFELVPRRFSVSALAWRLAENFKLIADEKSLCFVSDIRLCQNNILLHGDSDRLSMAISCLLDNAIKFSVSGEVVFKIEVSELPSGKARVSVRVSDCGKGFCGGKVNSLNKFGDDVSANINRGCNGFGVGIYISSYIVREMEAHLFHYNKESGGAVFGFDLELQAIVKDEG